MQDIVLGFATPAQATGVLVRQTSASGFLRAVVLVDTAGTHHAIWSGIDPSAYGEVAEFIVRFPQTTYDVAAVRLVIDTDHAPGEWEGIDAVRLLAGGSFASVSLRGQSADGQGGTWQEHVYNAQGRTTQTQTRNQAGLWQTVTYAYDSTAGFLNETITTDVLGQQTRTTYDAQGRVLSSTAGYGSAQASTTSYAYDSQGRLLSLTDPNSNVTSWAYDEYGREVSLTDPLGKSVTRGYEASGQVAWVTDRQGRRREFSYDASGQITEERWIGSDGVSVVETIAFAYDSSGRLDAASSAVGAYWFSYDTAGQLTEVTGPWGVTLTFGYDDAGNRISVGDSLGGSVTSSYVAGMLATRTFSQTGQPTLRIDQDHDAFGRLTEQRRYSDAAGTTLVSRSEYAYDAAGRLVGLTHRNGAGGVVSSYAWQYDAVGQLVSQTDHGRTVDYAHDAQGQLVAEDGGVADLDYAYDANGNRDGANDTVGAGNRLTSDGVWNYAYSDEGNLIQKTRLSDGQVWNYGWDHRNQLSWAERRTSGNALQTRAEYRYDAWGNRVEKKVDWNGDAIWDTTQRYVLDGWNGAKAQPIGNENWDVYLDLDASNGLETRYLRGDVVDELFARVDQVTTPKAYWTLLDHQGSVRDVIDESGAVKASARYDGYGNVTERTTGVMK